MKIKILLMVLLVFIFLAGCAPVVDGGGTKIVAQQSNDFNMELVAKHNDIEVWRFSDNIGLSINYCYVALNTRDLGTPAIISCP